MRVRTTADKDKTGHTAGICWSHDTWEWFFHPHLVIVCKFNLTLQQAWRSVDFKHTVRLHKIVSAHHSCSYSCSDLTIKQPNNLQIDNVSPQSHFRDANKFQGQREESTQGSVMKGKQRDGIMHVAKLWQLCNLCLHFLINHRINKPFREFVKIKSSTVLELEANKKAV